MRNFGLKCLVLLMFLTAPSIVNATHQVLQDEQAPRARWSLIQQGRQFISSVRNMDTNYKVAIGVGAASLALLATYDYFYGQENQALGMPPQCPESLSVSNFEFVKKGEFFVSKLDECLYQAWDKLQCGSLNNKVGDEAADLAFLHPAFKGQKVSVEDPGLNVQSTLMNTHAYRPSATGYYSGDKWLVELVNAAYNSTASICEYMFRHKDDADSHLRATLVIQQR